MRFIINGRETYNILEEFKSPEGSGNRNIEYIIIRNGEIIFWRENTWPIENRFLNIRELKDIIRFKESNTWRSEERKKSVLNHLNNVLSLMISHNRNLTIDELLTKETHYDILCYAC